MTSYCHLGAKTLTYEITPIKDVQFPDTDLYWMSTFINWENGVDLFQRNTYTRDQLIDMARAIIRAVGKEAPDVTS